MALSMQRHLFNRVRGMSVCGGIGVREQLRRSASIWDSKDRFNKITYVDDVNFDTDVISSKHPIVLHCHAQWCRPCKVVEPRLHKKITGTEGRVLLAKMDVDHSPETVKRLKISHVPTIIVYKLGREMRRQVGVPEEEVLYQLVDYADSLVY
eukprot:Plantae.Rhodophyta-Purpureofilum_apyrenoidigerum.ctg20577.p1 GENE.Plantae.Rhodophyta-Purpureofilum_apyrenoidigerum.ctg20577~~Plantae.Rhodophyta-Purpureofilum_apyrenoidigerum.ctg20577.p1  ORF type:complete len:152 (-),score=26.46 Plantae.Rhodophyta-Purpureofilum_apyrenoidigerum.ctg20577:354-809(-)